MFWKQSLQDLQLCANPARMLLCCVCGVSASTTGLSGFLLCNSSTFGLLKGEVFLLKNMKIGNNQKEICISSSTFFVKLRNQIIFLRKGEMEKKKRKRRRMEREKKGNRKVGEEKRKGRENRKEKGKASFLDQRKMQQLMELFLLGGFPAWIADFCKFLSDQRSWIPVSDSSATPFSYYLFINYSTSLMHERLKEDLDFC